jgi:putative DNA primase/helicase
MGHGYYVQFSNVTWDVANDCEVTPDPDMYITATLPVELDMDAPYGDADRFIESISGGDEATSRTMQEIIGACMCCKRVLSQSPMLIGRPNNGTSTASNGKSTYIDVLRAILGDENVSSMDIAALGDRFGPAELMGKLANLGDDIPDGFLHGQELSLFKKLVTGNEIKAERKYHEPFTFKPTATMVFSMNAMPRLADTTEGVFRRLAFIPFRRTFSPTDPDYDPNIIEKLTKPETLRRFAVLGIMALHDLLSDGRDTLTEIPDMVAAVEEVRTDNDVVKRWVYTEGITEELIKHRWVSEVYQEFIEWCKETHEKEVSQRTFTKRILVTFVTLRSDVMRDKLTDGKLKRAFVEKS